jgi:hypothetical protein
MTRFGHWMVLNIPLKHCGQHPFLGMWITRANSFFE